MCDFQETMKSWVNEVLKNKNLGKIEIEFPDFDTKGGYSAEMSFARVTAEKNNDKRSFELIIKRGKDVGDDPLNLRVAYYNEIQVYSQVIPYFQKLAKERKLPPFTDIPYCYGTLNKENQYVIIMENLKPKGFRVHNIQEPMDVDHVKLVLEAYAKWHAFSFALRDQQPNKFEEFSEYSKGLENIKIFDCVIPTYEKELENVMKIYRTKNKPYILEKLKLLRDKCEELIRGYFLKKNEEYLVIRHGDCWMNNFLFRYNETETNPDKIVVIDWQMANIGSPMVDLAHFLFYGCSRTELDQLDDLLDFYYSILSKNIKDLGSEPEKCFPKEMVLKSFKKYIPSALVGMPIMARMTYRTEIPTSYDVTDVNEAGNFDFFLEGELRDKEGYFNRIDGVLQLCIDRGFL